MRPVLTNLGSAGDVQPLVALAIELGRNGHRPLLALAPYFASYVRDFGLDFAPLGPDLDYPELQRRETTAVTRGLDHVELLPESLAVLRAMMPLLYKDLRYACRDADVLISGQLQTVSPMLHELTGIPFVSVHTNHFGGKQPGPVRNAIAEVVNEFRAGLGLAPVTDPIHTDANSAQLALYAMSRYYRPPSADWPDHYHVTGFFYLDEREQQPPADVAEFLATPPRPVVITFSSVAHEDPQRLTELLLEAIRTAGCRAIIQRGWSGLAQCELPAGVKAIGFVQHGWLFQQASCVIHHGGSGTTASAIRAGVPSIIVPVVNDQPIWAELTRELGGAGFVIPFRELTAGGLARAISGTLAGECYYRDVALLQQKVRAEQGVKKARVLIEQLLDRLGLNRSTANRRAAARAELINKQRYRRRPQDAH